MKLKDKPEWLIAVELSIGMFSRAFAAADKRQYEESSDYMQAGFEVLVNLHDKATKGEHSGFSAEAMRAINSVKEESPLQ